MKTTRDALNNLFKIIRHFPEKDNQEFYSSNSNLDKEVIPSWAGNPKFLGPQIYTYDLIKLVKDKLVFLDVDVDPNEHVYPMLEAGNAMDHMWLDKDKKTWE